MENYDITDSDGNTNSYPVYVDENISEDQYQKSNKSFSVVDDSTISLRFLMYIDVGECEYLIDKNDANIN
jgi:hypothetical protein